LEKAVDLCRRDVSWVVGALGHAYAVAGDKERALAIHEELQDRAKRETIDLLSIAVIHAGLRNIEKALASLEKAVEARGMSGILIKEDPRFEALHSEPRFQSVLKRMKLSS